jgi:hypothetical protein
MNAARGGTPSPAAGNLLANGRCWVEADGVHIDVRGLPPPEPMVAILALVQSMRDASPVIVHHERDPRMLYPELAELGWEAALIDGDPGEIRLRLARVP